MSKFQIVLTYIKKYIFWVISILCLLLTLVVGKAVTGGKQADFKARESAIEGRFSEMQRLAGEDLSNETVVDQKKKDVENLRETIIDAWYQLYNPQVRYFENLWPDFRNAKGEVDAQAADYLDELQGAWRGQTIFDSKNEISTEVADAYREYVTRLQEHDFMTRYKIYVPQLAGNGPEGTAMAGAMVSEQINGATNGVTTGVELPSEGMCTWDEQNRVQMRRRFRILSRPIGNGKVVSTRKILLVQQDIWMYNILLGAISKMNEKSEGSHDAVVKKIFQIDVADDASVLNETAGESGAGGQSSRLGRARESTNERDQAVVFNAVERVVTVEEPRRTGNEELGEGEIPPDAGMEEEGGTGMADTEFEELFDYRYCDAYGNFMSSADLAAYLKTKPEYIMMPVHVKILINQQKIPQFLLNCLNSEIPIYVHQISMQARDPDQLVRHLEIVPEEEVSTEDGEGGGRGSSRESRRSSRDERMDDADDGTADSAGMMEDAGRMNEQNGETDFRKPEDVEFEMWGMICVFNKPDETKFDAVLGEGEAAEGEEEGEEASENEEALEGANDDENAENADEDEPLEDADAEENVDADADVAEEPPAGDEAPADDEAAAPDEAAAVEEAGEAETEEN